MNHASLDSWPAWNMRLADHILRRPKVKGMIFVEKEESLCFENSLCLSP